MSTNEYRMITTKVTRLEESYIREIGNKMGGSANLTLLYGRFLFEGAKAAAENELGDRIMRHDRRLRKKELLEEIQEQLAIDRMTGTQDEMAWQSLEVDAAGLGLDLDTIMTNVAEVDLPARELSNVLGQCVMWLREVLLAHNKIGSKEIVKMAKEEGFSEPTLQRAKARAGAKSIRGDAGKWFWILEQPNSDEMEEAVH